MIKQKNNLFNLPLEEKNIICKICSISFCIETSHILFLKCSICSKYFCKYNDCDNNIVYSEKYYKYICLMCLNNLDEKYIKIHFYIE